MDRTFTSRRDFLIASSTILPALFLLPKTTHAQAVRVLAAPDLKAFREFDYPASLVVPGTSPKDEEAAALLKEAVGRRTGKAVRVIPARELSEKHWESANPILIGTTRSNSAIAAVERSLVPMVRPGRDLPSGDAGLLGVAYNPYLGSARDAILVTGNTDAGVINAARVLVELIDGKEPPATVSTPTLPKASVVKHSIVPGVAAPAIWAAIDGGFINEEYRYYNARFENILLPGGPRHVEALLAGETQVSNIGGNNALFLARLKGIPLKIIGVNKFYLYPDYPNLALIASPKAGVRTLSDLKGKQVAVNVIGGVFHFFLDEALTNAGVDRKEVRVVEIPIPGVMAALEGGTVDAGIVFFTFAFLARTKFGANVIVWDFDVREKGILSTFVTTDRFLKERGDLVVAWLRAQIKASRWSQIHEDEGLALAAKQVRGMTVDFLKATAPANSGAYDYGVPGDTRVFLDALLEDIRWCKKLGYIPADADEQKLLMEVADTGPLTQAYRDLGIERHQIWGPAKMTSPGPWSGLKSTQGKIW